MTRTNEDQLVVVKASLGRISKNLDLTNDYVIAQLFKPAANLFRKYRQELWNVKITLLHYPALHGDIPSLFHDKMSEIGLEQLMKAPSKNARNPNQQRKEQQD